MEAEKPSESSFIKFTGKSDFPRLLCESLIEACEQGANQLILCDSNFANWPLSDDVVIEALNVWANSHSNRRVMDFVASTYGDLVEQHDPWVLWRRRWSHRVRCWETNEEQMISAPCIFWSEYCVLVVNQLEKSDGFVSREKMRIAQVRSQLNEILRNADAAFPATTLGLW